MSTSHAMKKEVANETPLKIIMQMQWQIKEYESVFKE